MKSDGKLKTELMWYRMVILEPTCEWTITLMTEQYFFMALKSLSSCFLPVSSCHFLAYLVKAFFLLLYLKHRKAQRITTVWQERMYGSITSMHRRALNDHTRIPVFIKSALALVTQVLSKDGFQGAQTTDRFDVSHNTHHNDRRSLDDGHRLNFFSLWLLCGRQKEADLARKTDRFKSVKHAAGKQRVIKR